MRNNLKQVFKGKKILVTGGTGSIGSEIVRQLIKFEPEQIRVYSRDETKQYFLLHDIKRIAPHLDLRFLIGDIRDRERLDMAMGQIDIVFHTAALKHVPFCEYNPFEAVNTNVNGTQNLIDMAIKHKVEKVIAISTDKAVNPVSILGTTKLLMEKMILATRWYLGWAETKFSVVRFGNVLNSRGSAVPLWRSQIRKGGPVTLTDPQMTRFFMTVNEAVKLIFKATLFMQGQEIFILKMPEKKISDLAQETVTRHGRNKHIDIQVTGRRDGEKIHEELFTEYERSQSFVLPDMYVVIPYEDIFKKRNRSQYLTS